MEKSTEDKFPELRRKSRYAFTKGQVDEWMNGEIWKAVEEVDFAKDELSDFRSYLRHCAKKRGKRLRARLLEEPEIGFMFYAEELNSETE